MLIIPAIDLKDGRCVRLRQGRMDDETRFSDDPPAVARRWRAAGARRLHLVDLDGAVHGRAVNIEVVRAIAAEQPDLPIQVGGGIRDRETVEAYLDAGVRWVIIGTRAVTTPGFLADLCRAHPGQVIAGLDARDGRVAVDGWARLSERSTEEVADQFAGDGVAAIIFTDIGRDGMLSGIDAEATAALAARVEVPLIVAGGVRDLDDVRRLAAVAGAGIAGAITGRAIYQGTLDLAAAQALADQFAEAGG